MAIDLIRKIDGEHWTCSTSLWGYILESAKNAGYSPQGTSQYDFDTGEPDDDWDSNDYSSKAGQVVHEEDAKRMKESLDTFISRYQPTEEDNEIILSFIEWLVISKDGGEDNPYYPGFEIW